MSVRASLLALFLVLVALQGCRSAAPSAATANAAPSAAQDPALPALRPLDARHAAAFRRTFDDLASHDRYIVALSPT